MTMPATESVPPAVGPYGPLLNDVLNVMDTLPPVERAGSFCGGIVLKASVDYYVVILFPPCMQSMRRMGDHFGEHYDNWSVIDHDYMGQLEVVHMVLNQSA